ncbi:MAG: glycosyltransferase family 2 protein [Deltaproteobacteria bacterium]|nr:glycosyltransferase family 2 protein [Deltaproteobacteria bacterium]
MTSGRPALRLLAAVSVDRSSDDALRVARHVWSKLASLVPGLTYVLVRAGEETLLDADVLVLREDHTSTSGRRMQELMRALNGFFGFELLILTDWRAFGTPLGLRKLRNWQPEEELLGDPKPSELGPQGEQAQMSCVLHQTLVAKVADWPERSVDRQPSGASLVREVARLSGASQLAQPALSLRVSPENLEIQLRLGGELRAQSTAQTALLFTVDPPLDVDSHLALFQRALDAEAELTIATAREPAHFDRFLLKRLAKKGISTKRLQRIAARNFEIVEQFESLEARLQDPEALSAYVAERGRELDERIAGEYRLFSRAENIEWPYSYLRSEGGEDACLGQGNDYAAIPKLVTFVYCIKNRASRTRLSLRTLLSSRLPEWADVMVVEDFSEDLLDASDLPNAEHLVHYIIDTGIPWTRSGLLNFGIRQATTPLVAACDADLLFPTEFSSAADLLLRRVDTRRHLLGISTFETETHHHRDGIVSRCAPYGNLWVYDRQQFLGVRGFDEGFIGWGSEERELESRLRYRFRLKTVKSFEIAPALRVFHLSHTVRTGVEHAAANRQRHANLRRDQPWLGNGARWGSFRLLELRRYDGQGRRFNATEEGRPVVEANLRLSEHTSEAMTPTPRDITRLRIERAVQTHWPEALTRLSQRSRLAWKKANAKKAASIDTPTMRRS